ncbi:MAG TPA: ABC transporter ATP-binding protein [Capsulimonadaceae bacterium]|nr:ABC transporter ATP-binding protein [Capsulimonadaceae bacterium]
MTTASDPVIDVRDMAYRIGAKEILQDVSLSVGRGEILCVMGMSGCGKTTLLHCIGALAHPSGGEIYINGTQIVGMDERELNVVREQMGLVFQYAALFDSLSVFDNVAFGLRRRKRLPEAEVRRIVPEKLALAAMGGTESLFPSELSGGMAKRVGLARALAMEPNILLYDEPTSGLDPVIATVIDELIMSMRDKLGVTSIVVSHSIESVFRISDKVAMMHEGRVLAMGTPEQIKGCDNPIVQQFIQGKSQGPIEVARR